MAPPPNEADGRRALADHAAEKATEARLRYGLLIDAAAILRMLDDRSVVRYPTGLRFDAEPLRLGEFAFAAPLGETPAQGFCLFLHPCFRDRPEAWPFLIAYHLPVINYGEIVTPEDCERFAASLLGMDQEQYYAALCELADSIPPPPRGG